VLEVLVLKVLKVLEEGLKVLVLKVPEVPVLMGAAQHQ